MASDPYLTEEQAPRPGHAWWAWRSSCIGPTSSPSTRPLTPQTRGLLGRAQLEATKPGAFVLNVARGGIVDEAALADALRAGHLAGAAVGRLLDRADGAGQPAAWAPNVVLTPHLGASTSEAQDRVGLEMAEQVVMALAGVTPPYAVNAPAVPLRRPRGCARTSSSVAGWRSWRGSWRRRAFDALSLTYAGEIAGRRVRADPHRRARRACSRRSPTSA